MYFFKFIISMEKNNSEKCCGNIYLARTFFYSEWQIVLVMSVVYSVCCQFLIIASFRTGHSIIVLFVYATDPSHIFRTPTSEQIDLQSYTGYLPPYSPKYLSAPPEYSLEPPVSDAPPLYTSSQHPVQPPPPPPYSVTAETTWLLRNIMWLHTRTMNI